VGRCERKEIEGPADLASKVSILDMRSAARFLKTEGFEKDKNRGGFPGIVREERKRSQSRRNTGQMQDPPA